MRTTRMIIIAVAVAATVFQHPVAHAADGSGFPVRATVIEVRGTGTDDLGNGIMQDYRDLDVRIDAGSRRGDVVPVRRYDDGAPGHTTALGSGDRVVLGRGEVAGEVRYHVVDLYRLPALVLMFAIFIALAVAFAGIRGLTSVVGLLFSIAVLGGFVVPGIIEGRDPMGISIAGAAVIACFSVYFAHGFNRRTTLAVVAIVFTMAVAAVLAVAAVALAGLTGLGTEEAFYLQIGHDGVDMRGLLLGAIVLGAVGVLDDVATTQVAAIEEIARAGGRRGFRDLFRRGRSVGAEHIASLVNTLALAYLGSSLPLFLLFTLNVDMPFWVVVNGEIVAEELVRTLVGSAALVCAVPVSTALAAYAFSRRPPPDGGTAVRTHAH